MNVLALHEDPIHAAKMLSLSDPARARKQLVECCQLLAAVDHALDGATTMRCKNGEFYKAAHPHHPITKRMQVSADMYYLCYDLADALADIYPSHASAKTLREWNVLFPEHLGDEPLVLCRLGQPAVDIETKAEYVHLMKEYCFSVKGMSYVEILEKR